MVTRPRISGPVDETLERVRKEHGYPTLNEAIRHVLREADYDV